MTEQELINYRLHSQLVVHSLALTATMKLVNQALTGGKFLQTMETELTRSAEALRFPGASAAMSDLQAAEFQEALKTFLDGLKPKH